MIATLALVALAAAVPTLPAPAEERDWDAPPPAAAPADQALWRDLRDAGSRAVVSMGRLFQARFRIRYGKYVEALEALERSGPDGAERARAARERLDETVRAADEAIPRKGLRVRVCRYTLRDLDQRLELAPEDPAVAADLPRLRGEARACLAEVGAFAARLAPEVDAVEAAIAAADATLGRAAPEVPPYQALQAGELP